MRYDTTNGLRINQAYVAANDIKQIFIQKNNNVDTNALSIYKGFVGIGTTAPGNILQVGAGGRLRISNGTTGGQVYVTNSTAPFSPSVPVTVSGDITLSSSGLATIAASAITTTKIANNSVTVGKISTTSGTAGSTTYLRGDGTWSTPSSGGSSQKIQILNSNVGGVITDLDVRTIVMNLNGSGVTAGSITIPSSSSYATGTILYFSIYNFTGTSSTWTVTSANSTLYSGNTVNSNGVSMSSGAPLGASMSAFRLMADGNGNWIRLL
jgi:hypothetical protein